MTDVSRQDDIVFVKTSSLGDVVHQFPAITDARRFRPHARISWVVEEAFAPLARLHPAVDDVVTVATRRWRRKLGSAATWREIAGFARRLRQLEPSVVIDTQGLVRSAVIARLCPGIHHGYDRGSVREPPAAMFYDHGHAVAKGQHAIARNRQLTSLALGYPCPVEIDYGLAVRNASSAGGRYAMLMHGTSRPEKEWPEASWIEVGRWLRSRGMDVVLPWGTEPERQRAGRIADAVAGARVLERQPLDSTTTVIAGASLVVGVDTGLVHVAAACGVPLIAIFLSSDPSLTGPMGPGPIDVVGSRGVAVPASRIIESMQQSAALR